ncbi:Uncharacterised protein [Mycobacterium tuberculosis]|nr:Uncharacterised protein [Mycobacterium tuberculosis]CFE22412.1 Uncharacterised protein [Mycobacterium tuberculosis]CKM23769.1 Uncharacterised protein [Mycobacterium tuberculosis]CKM27009.1 Uncharacterised protein [Mycobacterium tuberculosis]CMN47712.1 Uncharacterised protein [Mycobacterium tuberculosis]
MADFLTLSPEVNSARMYAGGGARVAIGGRGGLG